MPSVFLGCQIQDDINLSLSEVRAQFEEYRKEFSTALDTLAVGMAQLSGEKKFASLTVGTSVDNNEVKWTANESGRNGNYISISYVNKGPIFILTPGPDVIIDPRPPSANLIGDSYIEVTLAIDVNGEIDPAYDVATSLPIWLSNVDVANLVTAEVVGTGAGLPEPLPPTSLSGGEGTPLKDAEEAANQIAQTMGHTTYQGLMKAIDLPIVETEEEAAAYLENIDATYVLVNKKLLIVEGTNLVGLRQLYNTVGKNVQLMNEFLARMKENTAIPYMLVTQNVEYTQFEIICGEQQPIITIQEVYRDFNKPLKTIANQYADGDTGALNIYVLWLGTERLNSLLATRLLEAWGIPGDYVEDILTGISPTVDSVYQIDPDIQLPTVATIEDPDLLSDFGFTNAEIAELLDKEYIEGVKPPKEQTQKDRQTTLTDALSMDNIETENGLISKIKKPVLATQAIDLSKTMGDENLAKELATRGKACARVKVEEELANNAKSAGLNLPDDIDIPNLPSADMPDFGKQIESAFGALSSVISSATKLFDFMVKGLTDTVKAVLNKVQNLLSIAENIFKNNLVNCLLGTGANATGLPEVPGAAGSPGGGGAGATGGSGGVSIGGIPIPMSLLTAALEELSTSLDEKITEAMTTINKMISFPLCMVQKLVADIQGVDLGGIVNVLSPCKAGKDPNDNCPPEEVQEVINSSEEMSKVTESLDQLKWLPTEAETTEVTETVEKFLGDVTKTATTTTQTIERGISETINDINTAIQTKVEVVEKLDQAIKDLISDAAESAVNAKENETESGGCTPPSIGMFTDSVLDLI